MTFTEQERVRAQRLARTTVRDVAPTWDDPLADHIADPLSRATRGLSLVLSARSNRCIQLVMRAMDDQARLIVLEPDVALARLAETKLDPSRRAQAYVQRDEFDAMMEMKSGSFDLIVAHLILGDHIADWQAGAAAATELLADGGHFIATIQGHGTWRQIEDVLDEVLRQMGQKKSRHALAKLRRLRPSPSAVRHKLHEELGLSPEHTLVTRHRQQLVFPNGRQFLASPAVVHGPLKLWRTVVRDLEQRTQQEVFWRLSRVLDAYHEGRPIGVDVDLIRVIARRGGPAADAPASVFWARFPSLAAGTPTSHSVLENTSEEDLDIDIEVDIDIDIDIDLDEMDVDVDVDVDDPIERAATSDSDSDFEETNDHATISDPDQASRPKTAAQRLIDAQILDEDDLVGEVLPEDYDPSHALSPDLEDTGSLDSEDIIGEFSLDFPEDES